MPKPPAVTARARRYLPSHFRKLAFIADPAATPLKLLNEYITEQIKSVHLEPFYKTLIIDWLIGEVSRESHFSLNSHFSLFQEVEAYLSNDEVRRYMLKVFKELGTRYRIRNYSATDCVGKDVLKGFGEFSAAAGRQCRARKLSFKDEERVMITQTSAWMGDSYFTEETSAAPAPALAVAKSLKTLAGAAKDSARTFCQALNSGEDYQRESVEHFLGKVGLANSFDFMSSPELRRQVSLKLGDLLFQRFKALPLDRSGNAGWEAEIAPFKKFGLEIDISNCFPALLKHISRTTKNERSPAINYPSTNNPASYLVSELGDSRIAVFAHQLNTLREAVTGFDEKTAEEAWTQTDEAEVAKRFERSACLEQKKEGVMLQFHQTVPLGVVKICISDDPLLVREFFMDRSYSGPHSLEIDPVMEHVLERVKLPEKTDKGAICLHEVLKKFSTVRGAFITSEKTQARVGYFLHRDYVRCELLRRLTSKLDPRNIYAGLFWCCDRYDRGIPPWWKDNHEQRALVLRQWLELIVSSPAREKTCFGNAVSRTDKEAAFVLLMLSYPSVAEWAEKNLAIEERIFVAAKTKLPDTERPYMAKLWSKIFSICSDKLSQSVVSTILKGVEHIEKEVDWISSRASSPYSQFLFAKTGRVWVPARSGDFEEFRPYALGDEMRRIDWMKSSRASELVVKKYLDEETRHLNLVCDASIFANALEPLKYEQLPEPITDLLMHIELAHREGLRIDLTIAGRCVVSHHEDVCADCGEGPKFKTKAFWQQLLAPLTGVRVIFERERFLFGGSAPAYNIFEHERPALKPGRFNYFVFSNETLEPSTLFLDAMTAQGELVEAVSEPSP